MNNPTYPIAKQKKFLLRFIADVEERSYAVFSQHEMEPYLELERLHLEFLRFAAQNITIEEVRQRIDAFPELELLEHKKDAMRHSGGSGAAAGLTGMVMSFFFNRDRNRLTPEITTEMQRLMGHYKDLKRIVRDIDDAPAAAENPSA